MKSKYAANDSGRAAKDSWRENSNLDDRYGKIGIPAVAAALSYQSEGNNPSSASVVSREHKWSGERAAA